jgi:hypothetical protein
VWFCFALRCEVGSANDLPEVVQTRMNTGSHAQGLSEHNSVRMFPNHTIHGMFQGLRQARCIFLLTFIAKNLIYESHCASRQRGVRLDVRENYSNEERNEEGSQEGREEGRPGEEEEVNRALALASFETAVQEAKGRRYWRPFPFPEPFSSLFSSTYMCIGRPCFR